MRVSTTLLLLTWIIPVGCGDDQMVEDPSIVTADGTQPDGSFDGTSEPIDGGSVELDGGADGGAPDAVQDVATDTADGAADDVDPVCSGFGCSCETNDECDSSFCVETAQGKVCSKFCVDNCPEGYDCATWNGAGADVVTLCMPQHVRLCQPCTADADCKVNGSDAHCRPYLNGDSLSGNFCASGCDATADCPQGYSCVEGDNVDGAKVKGCVRDDGQCPCTARAAELGLTTACEQSNDLGTCGGQRACGAAGLSICDAPAAVSETCNDLDDDCDGKVDEGDAASCDDTNPCTYDKCESGKCKHLPAEGPCEDGDACTEADACASGSCKGEGKTCDDSNPCTLDACQSPSGKCSNQSGPMNGKSCGNGGTCNKGQCAGG